jgi:hypothetical protein
MKEKDKSKEVPKEEDGEEIDNVASRGKGRVDALYNIQYSPKRLSRLVSS